MHDLPELIPYEPGPEEPKQTTQPDLRLEDLLGYFRQIIPDYDEQVAEYGGTSCIN